MFIIKMKQSILLVCSIILLLVLAGCGLHQPRPLPTLPTTIDIQTEAQETPRPFITIWIHGTKLTPPSFMRDFFYHKEGMQPASHYENRFHLRSICQTLHEQDCEQFSLENLYIFGWSGQLSFKERQIAAQDLNREIDLLCSQFHKKQGIVPQIRLITHSHGGNVALNLAQITTERNWAIDELVLLACPVQSETMHLYKESLFKQVYSFYSYADLIQVIDPQGLYKNKKPGTSLFSHHKFENHPKLIQIETKASKRGFGHVEFLLIKFIKHLPGILKQIKEKKSTQPIKHLTVQLTRKRENNHVRKGSMFTLTTQSAA